MGGSQVLILCFWCSSSGPSLPPAHLCWSTSLPALLPSGGRSSYNDMGGPVISTQVTIPKDVSKLQQHNMQTDTPKKMLPSSHNLST